MVIAAVLNEGEVSIESLRDLFQRAFFRAEIDSDGDIYITEGLELSIWLSIDDEQRLIRFFTFVSWDEDVQAISENGLNHLNATIILVTFYVRNGQPGRLYSNYFMSSADGVIDSHIINMARRFSGASMFGARELVEFHLN